MNRTTIRFGFATVLALQVNMCFSLSPWARCDDGGDSLSSIGIIAGTEASSVYSEILPIAQRDQIVECYPGGKGSTLVSGAASFIVTSSTAASFVLSIAPSAVHFVSAGVGIGGDANVSVVSYRRGVQTTITVGPRIMFTFGRDERAIIPYFGAGYSHVRVADATNVSDRTTTRGETAIYTGGIAKFGFGIMLSVGEKLALPVEFQIVSASGESRQWSFYGVAVGLAGFLY